jgi:hypothetical protein
MKISLAAASLLLLAGCAEYSAPTFTGRLVVMSVSSPEMHNRCDKAWDLRPGQAPVACSWIVRDPMSPTGLTCYIVFGPGAEDAVSIELVNCATVDQKVAQQRGII